MTQPSRIEKSGALIIDLISNVFIVTAIFINSQSSLIRFIAIFIPIIYYPCLHTLFSRSIGDTVFNLKVVDRQGKKIGLELALKRFSCVLKYSLFILLLTNILFVICFSRTTKDIREISYNFEDESKTYLIKA